MQKHIIQTAYYFDPHLFHALCQEYSLSSETKAAYREMLDAAWMSDAKYYVLADTNLLAGLLGRSLDACKKIKDELLSAEGLLLKEEYLSSVSQMIWLLPWLQNQVSATQEPVTGYSDSQQTSLKDSVRNHRDYDAPTIAYLSRKAAITDTFRGWLPTRRYFEKGQVYIVSEELMLSLASKYQPLNITRMFGDMFSWLLKNANARPSSGLMPDFIDEWAGRSAARIARKASEELKRNIEGIVLTEAAREPSNLSTKEKLRRVGGNYQAEPSENIVSTIDNILNDLGMNIG